MIDCRNIPAQDFFTTYHDAFITVNPYGTSFLDILSLSTRSIKSVKAYLKIDLFEDIDSAELKEKIERTEQYLSLEVECYPDGRIQKMHRLTNLSWNGTNNRWVGYTNEYSDSLIIRRFFENSIHKSTCQIVMKDGRAIYSDGEGPLNLHFFYRSDGLPDKVLYGEKKRNWQYKYKDVLYMDSLACIQIDLEIEDHPFRRFIYEKNGKLLKSLIFHRKTGLRLPTDFFYTWNGLLAFKRDSVILHDKKELENVSYYNYNDKKQLISQLNVNELNMRYPNFPKYERICYEYNEYGCLLRKIEYWSVYGEERIRSIEEYDYEYY